MAVRFDTGAMGGATGSRRELSQPSGFGKGASSVGCEGCRHLFSPSGRRWRVAPDEGGAKLGPLSLYHPAPSSPRLEPVEGRSVLLPMGRRGFHRRGASFPASQRRQCWRNLSAGSGVANRHAGFVSYPRTDINARSSHGGRRCSPPARRPTCPCRSRTASGRHAASRCTA